MICATAVEALRCCADGSDDDAAATAIPLSACAASF